VPLFFVLSGYCIHRCQAKALAAVLARWPIHTWRFYARRFLRIYPTYVAAMIFVGLSRWVLLPWLATRGYTLLPEETAQAHSWSDVWINLAAFPNALPAPSNGRYDPASPYEWSYWTLALEIHLYLLYPLVLKIIQKFGGINMVILALVAGIAWHAVDLLFGKQIWPCFALRMTYFAQFWFTWCLGAYIAELDAERTRPYRGVLLWAAAGTILTIIIMLAGRMAPAPLNAVINATLDFPEAIAIGAFLLWSLEPARQHWLRSLPVRVLAFVGIFSYSLYAVHYTCLRIIRALIGPHHESPLVMLGACVVIVPAAFVFFMLVERWTLKCPAWLKELRRERANLESAAAP
jgi:peptidoglycan/LPS O-acetylase OafA/YrhL